MFTVPPAVVTAMVLLPSVDRLGHVKLIVVAVTEGDTAVPPIVTLAPVKFAPVSEIVDPVSDPLPLRPSAVEEIVGAATLMVNATVPLVPPLVVTEIVFAPVVVDGIVMVADVVEDAEQVAAVPLTLHVVAPTTKFVPVRVADEPTSPEVGETLVRVGAG